MLLLNFLSGCSSEYKKEVSVEEKAQRIDTLQRGSTNDKDEKEIQDIFLSTHGSALTRLKNLVNAGGDYHDLYQLLYHDIDNPSIRNKILTFFGTETLPASSPKFRGLSDIDDTLFPNWVDESYPKKTRYPGAKAFYDALKEKGDPEAGITFLSARPGDRLGFSESISHNDLQENGFGKKTVLLTGDLPHLINNELMAQKKVKNFLQYQLLFPENYVFIGDSGQGDVIAGRKMRKQNPDKVKAVFIHDVVVNGASKTPLREREAAKIDRIFYFDTYPEAALLAYQEGLLSLEDVLSVARQAVTEFHRVDFENDSQKSMSEQALRKAVVKINDVLRIPSNQKITF